MEFLREIAHLRPRTNTFGAVSRVRNALCASIHQFFQEHGFLYVHTPIITARDCRRRRRDVPRHHARPDEPAAQRRQGEVDYAQDFFGKPAYLTVSGQLEAEIFACALRQGLHVRPDVPRRELQHAAPPGRVLDGRAGDGLLRPGRQHGRWPRRSSSAIIGDVLEQLPRRTWSSSTSASTTTVARDAGARRRQRVRARPLHRGGRDPGEVGRDVRVPGRTGAPTCRPSTSAT